LAKQIPKQPEYAPSHLFASSPSDRIYWTFFWSWPKVLYKHTLEK